MHKRTIVLMSSALAACVAAIALLWLPVLSEAEGVGGGLSAHAALALSTVEGPADELHVCPSGCIYSSVQAAVDAAIPGDVIKVAQGTYTDIQQRAGITQVVYISKTVTIRGGYTTTNWTTPYPITQPTTLDAQGQGRVLVITDTVNVTVMGLRITGGDATGLGGTWWADVGGGVHIHSYWAMATISDCVIISNTASTTSGGAGGGVYLGAGSIATLSGNRVISNTASTGDWGYGGGLYLSSSTGMLSGNTVQGNTASIASAGVGGGLYLSHGTPTLSGNAIIGNTASKTADGYGGGLYMYDSDATLSGNTVRGNTASTAQTGYGGGLYLDEFSDATLVNDVVADNRANTAGSGLYILNASPRLLHTTIACNSGGDGIGVYITDNVWGDSTVALTNTIIVSHTVGITVTEGNTATLNATLWHGNGTDSGGAGSISTSNDRTGDSAFAPDGYHLTLSSAAIDQGVNAGVTTDIDGDTRPDGCFSDIGADEFITGAECKRIYLPVALRER